MNVFGRRSIRASVKFRRQMRSRTSIPCRSTPGWTPWPIANSQLPTGEAARWFGANLEFLHLLARKPPRRRPVETRRVRAGRAKNTNTVTEAQLRVNEPALGLLGTLSRHSREKSQAIRPSPDYGFQQRGPEKFKRYFVHILGGVGSGCPLN
jgi:hypothetical protein